MANTFGLDIGSNFIKTVWLTKTDKDYFLSSVFSSPTPARGMLSESPLDQEEMSKAISQIVSNANIKTKKVNIALPENQVFTRIIEMPNLSEKELASAIYYEAEQYIPIPIKEVTLDYKIINRPLPQDPKQVMNVLLVGAPNSIIHKYENVITLAGLELVSIEGEIISIFRSVVREDNFPPSIILNIGASSSSMAIARNSLLVFVYSISIGGTALTRAIASDFGFSTQQAEEYKKTYGVEKENFSGKIGRAALPILANLSTEVKKAIAFYKEKYANEDLISQIILTGGSANLPGLDAYFTSDTGIETIVANPWDILKNKDQLPQELKETAPSFTTAVGLAMRDL